MLRRLGFAPLAAALALAGLGCGEDLGYQLPVHPTSGKVAWKGEPVKGAFVRFHPVDPRSVQPPPGEQGPPIALTTATEADGTFVMSSYYADDGVPAGDYVVTVTPAGAAIEAAAPGEEDAGPHPDDLAPAERKNAAWPTFARLYRDPATSPLKAAVKPGGENRFTFDLSAVDPRPGRSRAAADVN
ncbi:hypothetical protein [Paludisphaera mucosa]|uniref:Carboxypeptidase regulatory-like domain-containing protein n=1 Tax=Paludisphaera mucosa TaxID=3030827 RepID=A0ABT6FJH1_9BACT|nr:hypothetical protein [Paludisphaera mucosa]MDG3007684.1 hypothetical protein [Paludisphaera mucosa]